MTRSVGIIPYKIDALGVGLCRRPRLWWFNWVVEAEPGATIHLPPSAEAKSWGQISFDVDVTPESYLPRGWTLAGGKNHKLPTLTTRQNKAMG